MKKNNAFNAPSTDEAHQLYSAAVRVKELAPWKWMDESELFGVQSPETGELGFVSIMGMAGEHFAVAVYQGAKGCTAFWISRRAIRRRCSRMGCLTFPNCKPRLKTATCWTSRIGI